MIRVQSSIYHLLADTCSVRIDLKATFNAGTERRIRGNCSS